MHDGADPSPADLAARPFPFPVSPQFGGSFVLSKPGRQLGWCHRPYPQLARLAQPVGGIFLLGSVCLGCLEVLNGPDTRLGD